MHGEAEHGQALRVHRIALFPCGLRELAIAGVVERERVNHVGLKIGLHVWRAIERREQIFFGVGENIRVHVVARFVRLAEAADDVSGHEHAAIVIFPPAPAAIIVLESLQPLHSGGNFLFELGSVHRGLQMKILHRFGDDDVRKEAGHGLLGAAVGIAGEVIECIEETAGHRGTERDVESGRGPIGIAGKIDGDVARGIGGEDAAGFCVADFHAERNHRKRQLQSVRFFVGERFGEQIGFGNGLRAHAPVKLGFAAAGNFHLARLAIEDVETFESERDVDGLCRGQIIVDDGADDYFIALAEESRDGEAHHQIFAHDDAIDGAADFCVAGDAAHRGAPRGE